MKIDYHVAAEMRARGLSYGQIARRFHMTPEGVKAALKRGFTGVKTETYIGPMCKRGHDDGGGSRRYMRGSCVRCSNEASAERLARDGAPLVGRGEKYTGLLCQHGHDDGTGHSLRYRVGRACVDCTRVHADGRRESSARDREPASSPTVVRDQVESSVAGASS